MSLDVSPAQIIAAFTNARRVHEGLTPAQLEKRLGLPALTVVSAERGRFVATGALAKLAQWNGLDGEGGK